MRFLRDTIYEADDEAKQTFAKEQPVIDMANDTLGDWTHPAQEDKNQ